MAPPKVVSGARALVQIVDPVTNIAQTMGTISSISYSWMYATQEVALLGRFTVAEIDYVGVNPVGGSMTGWRVFGHDAHSDNGLPALQDLLTADYAQLQVLDRQNNAPISVLRDVRIQGASEGANARALIENTIPFVAIYRDTETTTNAESAGAADLP